MYILQQLCLGQSACSVDESNNVFGDPCVGTHQGLNVEVACL